MITFIALNVSLLSVSSLTANNEVSANVSERNIENDVLEDKVSIPGPYQDVLDKYMNAISSQDPDTLHSLYSPAFRAIFPPFSEQNKKDRIGILSIDAIAIEEIAEITADQAVAIAPYIDYYDANGYSDIRYYYIGFDMDVCFETDIFYNGVKYEVLKIGKDGDTYSILGADYVYNFDEAVEVGCAFGSESERKARNVVEQRKYGRIVNFENEEITEMPPYFIEFELEDS